MISTLYHNQRTNNSNHTNSNHNNKGGGGSGSNHSSKSKVSGNNSATSFKSPFMYMRDDDSVRTLDFNLGGCSDDDDDSEWGSSFGEDYTIDTSQESFVIDDDDDLDELEKALELFAAKEEKQADRKKRERENGGGGRARRRSTGAAREMAKQEEKNNSSSRRSRGGRGGGRGGGGMSSSAGGPPLRRQGTNTSETSQKSVGSNKSLPLSALMMTTTAESDPAASTHQDEPPRQRRSRGKRNNNNNNNNSEHGQNNHKTLSASNRSLLSLCSPRDQLRTIFGTGEDDFTDFNWDGYFEKFDSEADIGTMSSELERAIRSKKTKRLIKLAQQQPDGGVSMMTKSRSQQGETVAHLVCREGCAEMLVWLIQHCKVSVRVRDCANKTPLHEVAWNPTFNPSVAMMLMSDSPELLWAPDGRGFLALDYVPKRTMMEWYDFLEIKQPMLRLALQFSRFKASSKELNTNQERLRQILERQLHPHADNDYNNNNNRKDRCR